jgi:hypothetical protein
VEKPRLTTVLTVNEVHRRRFKAMPEGKPPKTRRFNRREETGRRSGLRQERRVALDRRTVTVRGGLYLPRISPFPHLPGLPTRCGRGSSALRSAPLRGAAISQDTGRRKDLVSPLSDAVVHRAAPLSGSHLDKQTPLLKARGNFPCHCVRVTKQRSEMGSLLCPLGAGRPSGPFQLYAEADSVRSRL